MGRGDLTNEQWARLEPLLPKGKKSGRPPKWSKRQLINGIRWRTRTGAPWAGRAGTVRAVADRLRPVPALAARRHLATVLTALQAQADARGLITWQVSVDSTIARATSTPLGPGTGGPATRRGGRGRQRAPRPRARAVPGWADHQAAPGRRAGPETAVDPGHRRPTRRQPPVRGRAWRDPGAAPWPGASPHQAGPGAGR